MNSEDLEDIKSLMRFNETTIAIGVCRMHGMTNEEIVSLWLDNPWKPRHRGTISVDSWGYLYSEVIRRVNGSTIELMFRSPGLEKPRFVTSLLLDFDTTILQDLLITLLDCETD